MPVVVVATMKAKPESVDAVRDACKQAIEAVHQEPGCELYALHEADGTFVFVEQWAERRCTEDAQHGARDRRPVRHRWRAPRRCTGHQDAAARGRGRPGQGPAASLMGDGSRARSRSSPAPLEGQGRAEAVRLASDGANIIAVDICDQIASVPYPMATPDDLAETVKLVEDTGARIVAREADVRDRDALGTALQAGLDEFGRLDIVIANAGHRADAVGRTRAGATSIDVNLTGVHHTVDVAIPAMVEQGGGGAIVLTSSAAGLVGIGGDDAGSLGYTAAKHGVVGLMRAYANHLARTVSGSTPSIRPR